MPTAFVYVHRLLAEFKLSYSVTKIEKPFFALEMIIMETVIFAFEIIHTTDKRYKTFVISYCFQVA